MSATAADNNFDSQIEYVTNHHPHLLNNKLHFNRHKGEVTIEGRVGSYFEKQLAQEALRKIDGINNINNLLVVESIHH